MSGVEALGLLLGVLPLLISAIEHYDDVLRPIHRFREFNFKSQRFCDEFEAERTVFQAECQLLLGEFVGLDIAQEMLCEPRHPSWKNKDLCRRFEKQLGVLGTTCLSSISRIESKLKEIERTFKDFLPDTLELSNQNQATARSRMWLHARKKKLKFAFSEDNLRTAICDLRSQNEIFRVISSQIVRFHRHQPTQLDQQNRHLSFSKMDDLRKFQQIRSASCKLYDALCHACHTHNAHFVKFCLEATYDESQAKMDRDQVCFNLAYAPVSDVQIISASQGDSSAQIDDDIRHPVQRDIAKDKEELKHPAFESFLDAKWLEVESILDAWTDSNTIQHGLANAGSSSNVTDGPSERPRPDDLCVKLQKGTSQRVASSAKNLVIALDKHSIYYPSTHMPAGLGAGSTSLMEMLSSSKVSSIGNIPQLYRIRMANSLVTAVLKFYATPWLADSWESKNLLFNVNPDNWQSYTPSPHLIVRVSPSSDPIKPVPASPLSSLLESTIPNMTLFNLGVMLLELAYGAPFHLLSQKYSSLDSSVDERVLVFNTAYHLANNVAVYFGSGFADLVRKCLRCDFGEGEDLDNPRLQERLYEDVACRLKRMENGIRQSQGEMSI